MNEGGQISHYPIKISKPRSYDDDKKVIIVAFIFIPALMILFSFNIYYYWGAICTITWILVITIIHSLVLKISLSEWVSSEIFIYDTHIIRFFTKYISKRINFDDIIYVEIGLVEANPRSHGSLDNDRILDSHDDKMDISDMVYLISIQSASNKIEICTNFGWSSHDIQTIWDTTITRLRANEDISLGPNLNSLYSIL